eukprot:481668-Prymnesium_polylepis.1
MLARAARTGRLVVYAGPNRKTCQTDRKKRLARRPRHEPHEPHEPRPRQHGTARARVHTPPSPAL